MYSHFRHHVKSSVEDGEYGELILRFASDRYALAQTPNTGEVGVQGKALLRFLGVHNVQK